VTRAFVPDRVGISQGGFSMAGKVQQWLETAKQNAGWLIVFGVVEIVAGILSVGGPLVAGLTVAVIVGFALLVAGGARLVGAFMADSFGAGALIFVSGLIVSTTGFYFVIRPGVGLETLTLVLAIVLFVDGVTRTILSFKLKPVSGWGWMLAGGIVTILFACMVGWEFPSSSAWVIGTLVGFSLLMNGFTTITLAGTARKVVGDVQKAA
jgi:uncharacterized membrane protein HdeD (DUF308 family)